MDDLTTNLNDHQSQLLDQIADVFGERDITKAQILAIFEAERALLKRLIGDPQTNAALAQERLAAFEFMLECLPARLEHRPDAFNVSSELTSVVEEAADPIGYGGENQRLRLAQRHVE